MLAILSNIAFISYGALVWLPPVLGLHLLLLPLNAVRLMQMSRTAAARRTPEASARQSLLDPRTNALAFGVAGMTRRATVDRRAPSARSLGKATSAKTRAVSSPRSNRAC
jgi:hypothetical protein